MKDLTYGPLNMSLATQLLVLIIKLTIGAHQEVVYTIAKNQQGVDTLYCKIDDINIDLSALLKKANLTHITLSITDSEKYTALFPVVKKTYPKLTAAESYALWKYTTPKHFVINSLLRNDLSKIKSFNDSTTLKRDFILVMMLASGINKIEPTVGKKIASFRGEKYITDAEIDLRKSLIQKGGGMTKEHAFLSTSKERATAKKYAKKSFITFDNLYGKSIQSKHYQFLLAPTCIKWTHCVIKNKIPHFRGMVVNPLFEGIDAPTQTEVDTFNRVLTFATAKALNMDFITDHTKMILAKEKLEAPIMPNMAELPICSHNDHISQHDKLKLPSPDFTVMLYFAFFSSIFLFLSGWNFAALSILAAFGIGAYLLDKFFAADEKLIYEQDLNKTSIALDELIKTFKSQFSAQPDQDFINKLQSVSNKATTSEFSLNGALKSYLGDTDKLCVMRWECEKLKQVIALKDNPAERILEENNIIAIAENTFPAP